MPPPRAAEHAAIFTPRRTNLLFGPTTEIPPPSPSGSNPFKIVTSMRVSRAFVSTVNARDFPCASMVAEPPLLVNITRSPSGTWIGVPERRKRGAERRIVCIAEAGRLRRFSAALMQPASEQATYPCFCCGGGDGDGGGGVACSGGDSDGGGGGGGDGRGDSKGGGKGDDALQPYFTLPIMQR